VACTKPSTPGPERGGENGAEQSAKHSAEHSAYQFDPGHSRWLSLEMERASAALGKAPVAVLVAPFQVDGDSFDATERSLLARLVAAHLRERAGLAVADMTLVERALGAAARSIPEPSIVALAQRIGAHSAVVSRIGHDNAGRYSAHVEVLMLDGGSISRRTVVNVSDIPFGDTNPPYLSFTTYVEEIVAALGGSAISTTRVEVPGGPPAVPANIAELEVLAQEGPVQSAYLLQFLGLLHPSLMQSRERNVLFERSLIALDGVPTTPEVSVLRARAWAHLNRRPLALAVLDSGPIEGVAMRAYLDGNLDGLTAAVGKIGAPLPRLLATIELERARALYGRAADQELIEDLATQYPYWAPVVAQRLMLIDAWGQRTSAFVKYALDSYWPMEKFDLETSLRTAAALGQPPDEYGIAKLAFEHIEAVEPLLPTRPDSASPAAEDVVRLLQHLLVATVVDRIDHTRVSIGKPDAALEIAREYESLLAGQPDYLVSRGWTDAAQADELTGPAQAELRAAGYERLRQGALLQQGQTADAEFVLTLRHQFFPGAEALDPAIAARVFFDSDWPNLPGWGWRSAATDDDRNRRLRHCVEYSVQEFQCFRELHAFLARDGGDAAQLLAANRHRFIGHPQRIDFLADNERAAGNDAASVAVLEEAIAARTSDWESYSKRGNDLAVSGKPREALEVYLKYPGFHDARLVDRVGLSNYAYEAGSMLYWAGAYEQARPLYEIAAGLQTGSDASLTSASRLAILDGDLETALDYTAQRAGRYESQYAFRDLMMFLAALGDSETAWAIFNSKTSELDKPEFWVGAMALHRMEGAGLEEIANWAMQGERAAAFSGAESRAMRYVFMLHVTDREISDDLAVAIRERDPFPAREARGRPVEPVDGRLTMMASALAALQRKQYDEAFAIFERANRLYALTEFLPYYAWTSAQVGKPEAVERWVAAALAGKERTSRQASSSIGDRFEELVALALLEGSKGNVDSALDNLVKTNADVEHLEERAMFTRYMIAEAAELLYERTGEERYREFLVDFARRNSIIDPAFSWPHAFLAKHTGDASERALELARALYLDPLSRRANSAKPAEIEAARRLIARGNPMLNGSPARSQVPEA
jgi:tetratricopeptide (TPR) repeat protein